MSIVSAIVKYIPQEFSEIKSTWKDAAYSNIYYYTLLVNQEKKLLDSFRIQDIPVVVLKGTSAAQYYPNPHFRTMGDIDLLVKPEDYDRAANHLRGIGCVETTTLVEKERGRRQSFSLNEISIELHHRFSSRINAEKAFELDNMLFNAIPSKSSFLPEEENGLVLLTHIAQHIRKGLGLRQIIDWLMYVRFYLIDEKWYSSFQNKVKKTGLETYAKILTKMCQLYLGLTTENITWCNDADDKICESLIQYVMECGNFGGHRNVLQSSTIEVIPKLGHPIRLLKFLQKRGECNWKAIKRHSWLKPIAWGYQLLRYLTIAIHNKVGARKLEQIYSKGQKRNELFDALEGY